MKTPQSAVDAVTKALETYQANGYTATEGHDDGRLAVAKKYSNEEFELAGRDVFLANGASGALWLAVGSVCPRGSNILLPRPGFTYCVAADPMEVECRYYDCLVTPPSPVLKLACEVAWVGVFVGGRLIVAGGELAD